MSASTPGGPLDTVATPCGQQSWDLDAQGNWSGFTSGGTTTNRTFNSTNETTSVSGGTAPTYDADGNTIAKDGKSLVYDAWNRLVAVKNGAVTLVSYAYDALRRRIKEMKGASTTDVYFTPGGQIAEERTGAATYQYIYGASGQIVLRDVYASGALQPSWRLYVQQDANSNVVALVGGASSTAGDRQEWYWYTPYGSLQVMAGDGSPRSGTYHDWRFYFQSGRLDASTGLYVFGLRDYDPAAGVWMERDHGGLAMGDANLYRFVGNNPVDYTDPMGLQAAAGSRGGWFDGGPWAIDRSLFVASPGTYLAFRYVESLTGEARVVWKNTGTACMSTPGRLYVTAGTTAATVAGVRGLSDAFSNHDAVDAHEQSWFERVVDFGTGAASMAATTRAVFPSVMKLMPGGSAGRLRIVPRGPVESPVRNPAAGECPVDLKASQAAPKTGDLFERTFRTPKGPVGFLAETVVEGDTLVLKDVVVYGEGTTPLTGLTKEALEARTQLIEEARAMGFKKLRLTGQRIQSSSSGNPGHPIDITADLTK